MIEEMENRMESVILAPRDLEKKIHGAVLCYPGTDLSSFASRVKQLKSVGIEELILEGSSKIGKFGIIGRGCVSTVVKARMRSEKKIVALKIRRVDANRADMQHDFELQQFANTFGVGPRAISFSKDLFAMEFIDATKLGKWANCFENQNPEKIHACFDTKCVGAVLSS